MTEKTGAAGNCYGGIAGINYATLSGCEITKITMEIKGVYTATSTSTAAQKESLASHAGGITGKMKLLQRSHPASLTTIRTAGSVRITACSAA